MLGLCGLLHTLGHSGALQTCKSHAYVWCLLFLLTPPVTLAAQGASYLAGVYNL